ncbi:MAG: DUF1858 domain-containing protein [Oscillospiraceae bacterium]
MEKILDLESTVYELCTENVDVAEILKEAGFTDIASPLMLHTAGRVMTIPKGARFKNIDMEYIKEVFQRHGYVLKPRAEQ